MFTESKTELDDLKQQMNKLQDELNKLLKHTGEQSQAAVDNLKSKLSSAVSSFQQQANQKMHDAYDAGREYSRKAVEKSRQAISERPFSALAAAFVGGMISILLLRRR